MTNLDQVSISITRYVDYLITIPHYHSLVNKNHLEKRIKILSFLDSEGLSYYVNDETNLFVVTFTPEQQKAYDSNIEFIRRMVYDKHTDWSQIKVNPSYIEYINDKLDTL